MISLRHQLMPITFARRDGLVVFRLFGQLLTVSLLTKHAIGQMHAGMLTGPFMVIRRHLFSFLLKSLVLILIPVSPVLIPHGASAENAPDKGVVHPRNTTGARKIRVGLYENKPKVFTNADGQASGIFVGILEAIARKENWQIAYVCCKWPECLALLSEGRIDLMPDVAVTAERRKKFDFHQEAVIESWSRIYANGEKPLKYWSDLDGRRIALLEGSIQTEVFTRMINGFGYNTPIVKAPSYEKAFGLAANGTVDAVVSNNFFGNHYYRQYGLKKTTIVFNSVPLYFATGRGANPALLEAIDHHLRTMKSEPDSVYYQELMRWMENPPNRIIPRYLVWSVGIIAGLLAFAFVIILLLRHQVKIKTKHLVQANETLHESEEKFRSIFQNHLAVKLIIDPDNGNIVEANEAAVRFYGWPGQKLRQMRIQDINTLPAEQVEEEMRRAKVEHRIHFEFRHRLADGSVRDVEVFSSKIEIKGKALLHSIVHDITEHRKLEEQYRLAQKMEAVGRLAGGVAHDYNNFLSVIIGYAELAMNKTQAGGSLYNYLEQIYTAAERSRDITRQLLTFARQETVKPEVIDLNVKVESLLKILQQLLGEDIELVWRPGIGLWPVLLDAHHLDQILANLCINARDAIADVGKITIKTGTASFDTTYCSEHAGFVPGDFVCLSVNDNGCGMDEETLGKIFEPFFTTKEAGYGTGLGLATVYGIVKQDNGFINVSSEPNKGTTFRIYLPGYKGDHPDYGDRGKELDNI